MEPCRAPRQPSCRIHRNPEESRRPFSERHGDRTWRQANPDRGSRWQSHRVVRACAIAEAPPLIACQLGELNEVAAGIVQHRNGRGGHVGGRHRELGAAGLDPLVVALDVVGVEHGRGLALLKDRLLIRLGRGVVVQRQLQLSAVRLLGRGHGQPAKWALDEISLLGKAQYLRIEAQGLVLVVHVYAGHFDFHFVSPFSFITFVTFAVCAASSSPWSSFSMLLPSLRLPHPSGRSACRGAAPKHPSAWTRTYETEPATHPPPEMV